jgi:predicted transcriptional regulator
MILYAIICHMKRTTIFVPEALERDLQLLARRDGKPAAAVVREAIAEYLAHRRPTGALPSFAGAFASGRSDTAERHEELLFATLSPHGDTKPPARAPASGGRKRSKPARRRSRS